MIRKAAASLLCVMLILVPAAGAAEPEEQIPSGKALVTIYRPFVGTLHGAGVKPKVHVDDQEVAVLEFGTFVQLAIEPGTHSFYSGKKSTRSISNSKLVGSITSLSGWCRRDFPGPMEN